MKHRWIIAPPQSGLASELAASLKLSPLLAQCLLNRGLRDPDRIGVFLQPRLRQLADPFLLPEMGCAVERLFQARTRQERLIIFGDYDVDGVTSAALLSEALTALGWKLDVYLPHRLEDGYGLNEESAQKCLQKWPATLLLAVDCGSTAVSTIAWLKDQGVDTLVLDHHQLEADRPVALALVNPQLAEPGRPCFRELCSAGLSFKLVHALVKQGRQLGLPEFHAFDLKPLLDLVALGTIADLVPLTGENRILVASGLERLRITERPGLRALKQVSGLETDLGVQAVAFQLAPRLNAAGRLENALHALQLLLARDEAGALPLAATLDAQNRERQQIERNIAQEAIRIVRARFNPETDFAIVEGQDAWHLGVVGIVASRVAREFYRPTVIIGANGDEWRGSGRSIDGFDLAAALRSCGGLLTRCGGHAAAAGLSLEANNLAAFRARLNEIARETLSRETLQPPLRIDAQTPLNEVNGDLLAHLSRLEPLGQGNPAVHLVARGLRHQRPPRRMGKEEQHVKMWVTDGKVTHETVWWNCASRPLPERAFDMVFSPELNDYNGRQTVQLKLLDWA